MNTFTYRDRRRQRIIDAIAALPDPTPAGLRESLEREQTTLQTDDWTVSDRTYLAIAEDWLWTARPLRDAVNADPVFTALDTTTALTNAQAAAIEAIPQSPGNPPSNYLTQVQAAIGDDPAILTELVHAAHHVWISRAAIDRPYPFDDVGVLLPLRLETLFDLPQSTHNPDPTRWKLSLRVIPDEASICRDNAYVSPGELSALQTFWESVREPGAFTPDWLESDRAGVAWELFCHKVAPPRAAWLASNLLPQIDGDQIRIDLPPGMPPEPQPNRVGGMPPQLQVWAVTRDENKVETRHAIGRLPMDSSTTIQADALALPQMKKLDHTHWLTSWEAAKAVGLGGEWLLDKGLTPETLEAIYVVGIGEESPDAHFRAQSDAGEMGVLRLGAPTNTVQGAPAADLATNAADWRRVARARILQHLTPGNNLASSSGLNLERHLTGAIATLPFFPGADAPDDTQDSQRLAQALWFPLLGHWLTEIWGAQRDAFRVCRWAFPPSNEPVSSLDEIREVLRRPCGDPPGLLMHNFCPEGPLMPLRISDQPYGLLPVTALSQWRTDDALTPEPQQQQVETAMAQQLNRLRSKFAAAARRNGTTAGKWVEQPVAGGTIEQFVNGRSTEEFMQLLGQDAISKRYFERSLSSIETLMAPYLLNAAARTQFEGLARALYRSAADLMGSLPQTLYLANGAGRTNRLPLVQPDQMMFRYGNQQARARVTLTRFLALLLVDVPLRLQPDLSLDQIFQDPWRLGETGEYRLGILPNSLLIRLLVYACQLITHWQFNPIGGSVSPAVIKAQCEAIRAISCELDRPDWNPEERDPETGEPVFLLKLPDDRRHQLERALCATLDSAAHRIDPWITGFAWQRLKQHSVSPRHTHRMGVYGWVDGPFLGTPGPTDAGRLHTPSYNQTLAAIILRDKYLSSARSNSAGENGRNPWQMNISSRKARLAEEIADEVRLGFHFYEVVGRQVENVIATHQQVKALRTSPRYAMRPERRDLNEVCNGIEALTGLLAGDPEFPLSEPQQQALQLLQDAIDTYGDLLMADGVMQLINRQTDRAAETMEAAAGFNRPPSFEFIRTPPSGYQLESLVVSVVPYVSLAEVAGTPNPLRLADPSLAAFVEQQIGDGWTWTAINQDNGAQIGTIALSAMGLTPLDTLALSAEFLSELARRSLKLPIVTISESHNREWTVRAANNDLLGTVSIVDLRLLPQELSALDEAALHDRIRTHLGVPADSMVEEPVPNDLRLWIAVDEQQTLLGLATVATLGLTSAEASALKQSALHQQIRQALGLAEVQINPPRQHLLAQHLIANLGSRPATGRDIIQDTAAQKTVDAAIATELTDRYTALQTACQTLIDELQTAATDAQRVTLLRQALGWGVTTISDPGDREALFAALLSATPPLTATPIAALVETTAKALQDRLVAARAQTPDGIPTLSGAIASLAVPHGKLAILACWSQTALLSNTQLKTQQTEAMLDETWLTVVAAVRQPLARLEALQLGLDAPLVTWSSSPGDPWHTRTVQENLTKRADGSALQMSLNERLVAAYGSAAAWAGEKVAVGMIDSFSEAIPMPQRRTAVGFGFNAPAARPPQAILLAVPPQPRQRIDNDLMLQIITETRELAHARTAHVEDLGDLQALTPTMWFQSSGPNRIRLESFPLFKVLT